MSHSPLEPVGISRARQAHGSSMEQKIQGAPQGSVQAAALRAAWPFTLRVRVTCSVGTVGGSRAARRLEAVTTEPTPGRPQAAGAAGAGRELALGPRPPATPRGDRAAGRPPGGSPKRCARPQPPVSPAAHVLRAAAALVSPTAPQDEEGRVLPGQVGRHAGEKEEGQGG